MCPEEQRKICPDLDEDELWDDPQTRCEHCPLAKFENSLASEKGQRLQAAQEICTAMNAGFQVSWQDLAADQFVAVVTLITERQNFEAEQTNKIPNADGSNKYSSISS